MVGTRGNISRPRRDDVRQERIGVEALTQYDRRAAQQRREQLGC
jgi:hypothetical protein